jgi:UDPglucose 6-dehydrogenase
VRISVIGCGYLGAVQAAALAELGHDVIGIDIDRRTVELLDAGRAPFHEPGLGALLEKGRGSGRLRFSTEFDEVSDAAVHFVAVDTPQGDDGAADLRHLEAAFAQLARRIGAGSTVVGKSTVPVGTAAGLAALIEQAGGRLVWNPEFLREGHALRDTFEPDRIVYGLASDDTESASLLDELYAPALAAGTPRIVTDFATAELVKVASNAFLATKISFINAMAEIAEATGADVTQLADAIGHDARIGRAYLDAGVGFGGGCLPKDLRGFVARADELGVGESLGFLREVDRVNQRRRGRVVELAAQLFGGDVSGRRIAMLGLAFKPDSDDVRDSPALEVARALVQLGAHVVATDPHAIARARARAPELDYATTVADAVRGAELVIVLTEWREYRELDPADPAGLVASALVVDGRNCLNADAWRAAGWQYHALGR